jgi:hypothetical protein
MLRLPVPYDDHQIEQQFHVSHPAHRGEQQRPLRIPAAAPLPAAGGGQRLRVPGRRLVLDQDS